MKIVNLSYKNRKSGWNIKDLAFNNLTLLVGASGVGKTQILRAILRLASIAKGKSSNGIEWRVSFMQDGLEYLWEGAFALIDDENETAADVGGVAAPIEYERLYRNNGKKELLIERDADSLKFNGQTTVKLEAEKSAIALLKEESDIMPVYKGFLQISLMGNQNKGIRISPIKVAEESIIKDVDALRKQPNLSMVEQLFLLYKHGLKEFDLVKERFISIFPFVEDLQFTTGTLFNNVTYPILLLKEKGVEQWISQKFISSGMFSALSHLVAITLAKDGDVILIDEFENSLGVNCINEVADLVLYPEAELQFVITSHHPYIINNIDYGKWKIVTRQGTNVMVHSANDLHIGKHSKHDAFMQLIQSSAYLKGIL